MADDLQFDTAEPQPGSAPAGSVCARCQKPITTFYYEALGNAFCSSCKLQLESQLVSGFKMSVFLRALVFGAIGALGGALLYFGVVAATGYEIGLIAILVGFMVGYMVHRGARGRGGRSYQALALTLTYLAIGSTYASLAIKELIKKESKPATSEVSRTTTGVTTAAQPDTGALKAKGSGAGLLIALGALFGLMVALPVIAIVRDLPGSLISALIIGFALRQAWIMNRAVSVDFKGPFKLGAAPAGQ